MEVASALFSSVIYGLGQSFTRMPLNLTTLPWYCSDKSPRIHEGQRRRVFGMWGYQIPSYLGQEPINFHNPPGQCSRPPAPSHARVPRQAVGTLSILQTSCLRELSKVSKAILCTRGNLGSLDHGNDSLVA